MKTSNMNHAQMDAPVANIVRLLPKMLAVAIAAVALGLNAKAQTLITNQVVTVQTNNMLAIVNNQVVTNPIVSLVTNFSIVSIPGVVSNILNAIPANVIPPSFIQSAESYFTSFNPSNAACFATTGPTTNHGQFWTGATLQNNVNLGQEIGGSYNIGKGFSVEALCLNAGVFNSILGAEVGPAYSLVLVDTRVSAILGAGERFDPSQFYIAGHLRLEKAITPHTFLGLDVGVQSGGRTDLVPQLTAFTGFSF